VRNLSKAEKERFAASIKHQPSLPRGNWHTLWEALEQVVIPLPRASRHTPARHALLRIPLPHTSTPRPPATCCPLYDPPGCLLEQRAWQPELIWEPRFVADVQRCCASELAELDRDRLQASELGRGHLSWDAAHFRVQIAALETERELRVAPYFVRPLLWQLRHGRPQAHPRIDAAAGGARELLSRTPLFLWSPNPPTIRPVFLPALSLNLLLTRVCVPLRDRAVAADRGGGGAAQQGAAAALLRGGLTASTF